MSKVAVKEQALVEADEFNSFLVEDSGLGTENVTNDDKIIPFLRVAQSNSKVRVRNESIYIPGLGEGDVYHSITSKFWRTGDEKNPEKVIVVPVAYQRRYTEWWPRNSPNGEGLVKDWGTDEGALHGTTNVEGSDMTKEGTEVVTSADFFCFIVDEKCDTFDPVVISMSSTQRRKARMWLTRVDNMRVNIAGKLVKPPMWYTAWELSTVPESNKNGNWFGWKIDFHKNLPEMGPNAMNVYKAAKEFHSQITSGVVKAAAPDEQSASTKTEGGGAPVHNDDEIPF